MDQLRAEGSGREYRRHGRDVQRIMVTVNREIGVSTQIDVNIKVIAPEDQHNQIATGINASENIEIKRDEIYAAIREPGGG